MSNQDKINILKKAKSDTKQMRNSMDKNSDEWDDTRKGVKKTNAELKALRSQGKLILIQ